jgi:hypothetical protein
LTIPLSGQQRQDDAACVNISRVLLRPVYYPPMQRGASFNLDAIKAEMAKRMAEAEAAAKGPSN